MMGPQQLLGQPVPELSRPAEAPSLQSCLGDLEALGRRNGISDAILAQNLRGLAADTEVLAAAQGQAEFETPIWEYVDHAVSEARISSGQAKLVEWSAVLDAIEARFGVDRHVVMAIWGIESSYGAVLEDLTVVRPVVRSLATL